ncbi:MAG: GH25 family lysozyme [Bacteroidota bacterium]
MTKNYFSIIALICCTLLYSCADEKKENKTPKDTEKAVKKETVKDTGPAFGIDISAYQGDEVAMLNNEDTSLKFIICKATQGETYVDPKFAYNWKTTQEKGFIRGAYHFFMSKDDPLKQAKLFVSTIEKLNPTDIPPIIDIEFEGIDTSQPVQDIQGNALKLLQIIESILKVTPIIYTNNDFANDYLVNPEFARYPLWIADYDSKKTPMLPKTWQEKGYVFWQKTDTYELADYKDDADVFNGDVESLKAFIKNSRK